MIAGYSDDAPEEVTYLGMSEGLPNDRVTALYLDPNGDLYIGTERSGLFIKQRGSSRITPRVISGNSLENIINAIDGNRDSIFVATNNGIYTLNPSNGRRTSFSTANGLPHNKVNDILVESDGTAWVATLTSGLVRIKPDREVDQAILEGRPKLEFSFPGKG